mmetsp:Transcript_2108/g.3846  ORF Transcript_2108/g.3846 Transcript_2108/m.3846 type:complete len:81 (+) Transcript_2108:1108-1350(+)
MRFSPIPAKNNMQRLPCIHSRFWTPRKSGSKDKLERAKNTTIYETYPMRIQNNPVRFHPYRDAKLPRDARTPAKKNGIGR